MKKKVAQSQEKISQYQEKVALNRRVGKMTIQTGSAKVALVLSVKGIEFTNIA